MAAFNADPEAQLQFQRAIVAAVDDVTEPRQVADVRAVPALTIVVVFCAAPA